MKHRWLVVALTALLLSGAAWNEAEAETWGAGTARSATSPTFGEPSPQWSLPERILQRARRFRGNPPWLGVATGTLLVLALGFGVVAVLGARD